MDTFQLFFSNEGITFFDISDEHGRGQLSEVQSAPASKLCWISLNDYAYPFMRFQNHVRYNLISCFMRINTLTSSEPFCFFIDINEREIASLLDKSEGTFISQFVIDASGKILSHPHEEMLGTMLPADLLDALLAQQQDGKPIKLGHKTYLRYQVSQTGWMLIVSIPESYLDTISLTSASGLISAVLIATLVAVFASLVISRQLTGKMKSMEAVIRSIEPSFSVTTETVDMINARMPEPPEGTPPDILDELAMVFNRLVDRLNTTMQSALSATLAQERLRYKLLRAKINPHFLYNMLDSIKICNSLGRTADANLILTRLASFYRLILRKNDLDIITIGEELEIIRLYLEMESISHEQAFSFCIYTDPDIELFSIPRFVLQPLVENCVTHGLPGDAKHMTVTISLRYEEDAIRIEICDNGLGMDTDTMERLLRVIHAEEPPMQKDLSTTFYGLNNVAGRLKPYVIDSNEPVQYISAVDKGTTVIIHLRQILQDE